MSKVDELGKSIGNLKNLEKLELSLWSSNVTDIDGIGKGLAEIKGLR